MNEVITLPDGSTVEWKGPGWYRFETDDHGHVHATFAASIGFDPEDDGGEDGYLVEAWTVTDLW